MTLVIVASLLHVPLGIAALVLFSRLKQDGDPNMRVARNVAFAMLGFEVVAVLLRLLRGMSFQPVEIVAVVFQDALLVLKLWVAVYVGITLWRQHGVDYWRGAGWRMADWRVSAIGATTVALMVGYTFGLFALTHPVTGPLLKLLATRNPTLANAGLEFGLLVAINFAIAEELIYRGCIQAMFTRWFGDTVRGSWFAILATTALWTVTHAGTLSPDWVKFLQVLPLGLFLGWWFKKAGFIGCASVHLVFNVIMMPLGPLLLPEQG